MNLYKQVHYSYYTSPKADFEVMLDDVLNQLPSSSLVLRLVCWCAPSNNEEYEQWLLIYRRRVREFFTDGVPGYSLVAQPPLGCGMVLEVHTYVPAHDDVIYYKKFEKNPYVLIENPFGRFLFASGLHGSGLLATAQLQSEAVFGKLAALLKSEGFTASAITRQWNYIERITEMDGEDQRYQSFNNARASYYQTDTWTTGYPAATGIGASFGGVCIDVDAISLKDSACVITPIDNHLQVAAHAYSTDVICNSGNKKDSPKFERAKSVELGTSKLIYISGTAAIRGEESLQGVGLAKQLYVTLENIAQLTNGLPLKHLRVYLKKAEDYEEAARIVEEKVPQVNLAFFVADVCRESLLIEIEGVATNEEV